MKKQLRVAVPFLWMFLFALIVGAIVQFAVGPSRVEELTGDQGDYHALAIRFKSGGVFGEPGALAYRAPLYPVLLGHAYSRLGSNLAVARGLNWLLAGGIAVLSGLIAFNLSQNLKAAWLATALTCTQSYWWLQQTEVMPENLATFCLGVSVWCWPNFSARSRAVGRRLQKHGAWVAASAVWLGLALLCKPIFLLALPLLVILAAAFSPANQRQSQVAFALIFVLVALIPVGGWTYRNYKALGQWVPITTGSGEVFWGAHAPETLLRAKGSWTLQPLPTEDQAKIDAAAPETREIVSSQVRWEAGWSSLRGAAPVDVALHFLLKPLRLWSPSTYFPAAGWLWAVKVPLILLNLTVLLGFAYQLRQDFTIRPLVLALAVSLTATAFIFWGTIRFQYLLLPVISGMAALNFYRYVPDLQIFRKPSRRSRRDTKFKQTKFD